MFANTVLKTLTLLVSPTHSTNPINSTNPNPDQGGPGEDMPPENINNIDTECLKSIEVHSDSSSDDEYTRADRLKGILDRLKEEIIFLRGLCDNDDRVKKFPIQEYLIMFTNLVWYKEGEFYDEAVSFFVTDYLDNPPFAHIFEILYNSIINPENNIDDSTSITGKKARVSVDLFLEFLKQKKERTENDILKEIKDNEYYIRFVFEKNDKIIKNGKIRRAYAEILADSIKFCNSYDANQNFCGKKYYAYKSFKKRILELKDWFVQECKVLKDNENLEKITNAEKKGLN